MVKEPEFIKVDIPKNGGDEEVRGMLHDLGISEADIYDYSESRDGIYDDKLRPNLTEEEIEEAMVYKRFLRGVVGVTGDAGAGKGLFGNVVGYKIKTFFQGRKALLDYKPKPSFGPYLPFDDNFLKSELSKMAELSKVRLDEIKDEIDPKDTKKIKDISMVADKWVRSKEGQIYLSNSVLVLEEFKRYMHNRRPMNPLGITLGHIITWWRHLDILILGMTPHLNEIDEKAFKQYMTHEVRCSWETTGVAKCNVYQTQWVSDRGVLRIQRKPVTLIIDGWIERPELGVDYIEDGEEHYYRYFDLYNSKFLPSIKTTRR